MQVMLFCFVASLLCLASLVACSVLHFLMPLVFWMKAYLAVLSGAFLLLLGQFPFFVAAGRSTSDLGPWYEAYVQVCGLVIDLGYLGAFGLAVDGRWRPLRLAAMGFWTAAAGLMVVFQCLGLGVAYREAFVYLRVLPVSLLTATSLLRFRHLRSREFGDTLILFGILSALGYGFEFLEYLLRLRYGTLLGDIPLGSVAFAGFGTLLAMVGIVFSGSMIAALRRQARGPGPSVDQERAFEAQWRLTARESEIVHLLLLRYTHREIADRLFISPRTVERHVYNVYQKTGISNRFELYDLVSWARPS